MTILTQGPLKIVCCGSVVLDFVFGVDEVPAMPVKVPASTFGESGGGLAATAAVAAAALGATVEFWGRIGSDTIGERLIALLAGMGVTARVDRTPGSRTPTSGIIADNHGERLLAFYRGEGLTEDGGWLPLERLADTAAVLCDVRWPQGASTVLHEARRGGIPTILDADVAPVEDVRRLVHLCDHALFSIDALRGLVGVAEPEEALRRAQLLGAGLVGVTLGAEGFMWLENDVCNTEAAIPVDVLDTNGAGDAFHGAYAFAIACGRPVRWAVRFACAVASLKCARRGSWDAMPSLPEVLQAMKEHGDGMVAG